MERTTTWLGSTVVVDYAEDGRDAAERVEQALRLLERAQPRLSAARLQVLRGVRWIGIHKIPGSVQGRARTSTGRIELDRDAVRRHRLGVLTWLICHEAYHLSDSTNQRPQGNANLFADRIRQAIEAAPALYVWGS